MLTDPIPPISEEELDVAVAYYIKHPDHNYRSALRAALTAARPFAVRAVLKWLLERDRSRLENPHWQRAHQRIAERIAWLEAELAAREGHGFELAEDAEGGNAG